MRKLLFLPVLLLLLFCHSCDVYMSDNGDLDGFWQLAQIDTIDGGVCDMVPRRIFWSVQTDLLQVSDLNYQHDEYIFRFEYKADALRLFDPYLVDHAGSDEAVGDAESLRMYGINALDESFFVERIDKKQMRLRSQSLRLYFNRY